LANEDDKPRYLCRICKEDLTQQIVRQQSAQATPVYHILADAPPDTTAPVVRTAPPVLTAPASKTHRVAVTCSKNHINIFSINA